LSAFAAMQLVSTSWTFLLSLLVACKATEDRIKVAFFTTDVDDCWIEYVFPGLDPAVFSNVTRINPVTNNMTTQELAHEYDVFFISGYDYSNQEESFALLEDLLVNYNQAVFSTSYNVYNEDSVFDKYMSPFKEGGYYDYSYFYTQNSEDSPKGSIVVDGSLDMQLGHSSTYDSSRYSDLPTYTGFSWNATSYYSDDTDAYQYYEYCRKNLSDCKRSSWEWVITATAGTDHIPVLAYSRSNGGIASYSAIEYCYEYASEGVVWYALAQNILISLAELSTGGHTCLPSQTLDPQTKDECGNNETCTDIIVGTAGGYHLRNGSCTWHIGTPGTVLHGTVSAVTLDIAASASLELEITYLDQSSETVEFRSSDDVFELKEALSVELRFISNEDPSVLGKQATFEEGFALTMRTIWRECTCKNGKEATDRSCDVDGGESCTACDAGYTLVGQECYAPCDSSEAPLNGAVGTCTSTLFYGTCQPECNTGYTVSGTTSCEDGTLTAATCAESCSDERSSYMIKNNKYCDSWHFLEHMCVKSSWKTEKFCQHSCHALGLGYEDEDCPMDSSCSNRPSKHMVEKQVTCESWPHLKYMCSKSHWVTKKFCQRSCFKIGLGYDGDVC